MKTDLPSDKLQAAVSYDWADPDHDFLPGYVEERQQWYRELTASDRETVGLVRDLLNTSKEAEAENVAAALPAAPESPVTH